MTAHLYIMASQRNGTLYVGVTTELARRAQEHRAGLLEGFTKQYGVNQLVYAEEFFDVQDAIRREKAIKKWNRQWKLELIEKANPEWRDLSGEILP